MLIILFFMSLVFAKPDIAEQNVQVYVDITEVHDPSGNTGTSMPLNILVSDIAQSTGTLRHQMQYHSNPTNWQGDIKVFDWKNLRIHMSLSGFENIKRSTMLRCRNFG